MSETDGLKRTPLYATHVKAGARMIEFGGWEMPVQFSSLLAEHRSVRSEAGLFDLSHMGELYFEGPDAAANLQRLLTNDVAALRPGQAQYTLLCNEEGGIIDDVILYLLEDERYLLVANAANTVKDHTWIRKRLDGRVTLHDKSSETALLALQGPKAEEILAPLVNVDLKGLPAFTAVEGSVDGVKAFVSRTGYTGEDGFELYCASEDVVTLWERLLEAGSPLGMVPVGLGARDTLRLEARLHLYGNDLNEQTTPIEAGLSFAVKFDKGDFVGRDALIRQREHGPKRRLVGFIMKERGGAPRHGYRILEGEQPVGEVTSGSFSPTLGKDIGLGYVPPHLTAEGTELVIEVRGRRRVGVVHKGRFVPNRTKMS